MQALFLGTQIVDALTSPPSSTSNRVSLEHTTSLLEILEGKTNSHTIRAGMHAALRGQRQSHKSIQPHDNRPKLLDGIVQGVFAQRCTRTASSIYVHIRSVGLGNGCKRHRRSLGMALVESCSCTRPVRAFH